MSVRTTNKSDSAMAAGGWAGGGAATPLGMVAPMIAGAGGGDSPASFLARQCSRIVAKTFRNMLDEADRVHQSGMYPAATVHQIFSAMLREVRNMNASDIRDHAEDAVRDDPRLHAKFKAAFYRFVHDKLAVDSLGNPQNVRASAPPLVNFIHYLLVGAAENPRLLGGFDDAREMDAVATDAMWEALLECSRGYVHVIKALPPALAPVAPTLAAPSLAAGLSPAPVAAYAPPAVAPAVPVLPMPRPIRAVLTPSQMAARMRELGIGGSIASRGHRPASVSSTYRGKLPPRSDSYEPPTHVTLLSTHSRGGDKASGGAGGKEGGGGSRHSVHSAHSHGHGGSHRSRRPAAPPAHKRYPDEVASRASQATARSRGSSHGAAAPRPGSRGSRGAAPQPGSRGGKAPRAGNLPL